MANHVNTAGPRQHVWARIFHWTNLLCMILLVLTGLHVKIPFISNFFGIHYFAGCLLIINLLVRFVFLFVGKYADWKQWGVPTPGELFSVVRYYLFMGPHYTKKYKYNGLQRLAYLGAAAMIIFQGLTGWALAFPTGSLAGLIDSLGGAAATRGIHVLFTYVFFIFTLIHGYMVFAYDPAEFGPMFWGTEHKPEDQKAKSKGKAVNA